MDFLVAEASRWLSYWVLQAFIVIFLALLADALQRMLLARLQARAETRTRTQWDDALLIALRRPLTGLIWLLGITFAVQIAREATGAVIFDAAEPVRDVGVVAMLAWFLMRLLTYGVDAYVAGKRREGQPVDSGTVRIVGKLLRVSVVITAALVALQTLGYSVSGVLAFGGIGGIAVGFAARDLLANFFGGLMIFLDQPFKVGDWVNSPDREIEGTVEDISWRLTTIRTFDQRPLYIPNSAFSTITVVNPSRMTNRRIFETIGVRYADAGRLSGILADVRTLLKEHPDIDQGQFQMVNFNRFAASSLDFFIYCFTRTTQWARYHEVKEDVLLKIIDIIEGHGAEIAFPTSTLHVPDGVVVQTAPPPEAPEES